MIILDTNVASEFMRPEPAAVVLRWIAAQQRGDLFLSAVTCAEVLRGVALMPDGQRRQTLAAKTEKFFRVQFDGQILPFDFRSAEAFAAIIADRRRAGRPMGLADAMIAGIARSHGATIATRDGGFAGCGVPLINPWIQRGERV